MLAVKAHAMDETDVSLMHMLSSVVLQPFFLKSLLYYFRFLFWMQVFNFLQSINEVSSPFPRLSIVKIIWTLLHTLSCHFLAFSGKGNNFGFFLPQLLALYERVGGELFGRE